MQCYCYGHPEKKLKNGDKLASYVSFTIPDIGISFKAAHGGDSRECEYTSLLALLEFVDLNPQLFKSKDLEIYSDSFTMVHQVNMQENVTKDIEPYRQLALKYKEKIPYTLSWVPKENNPAQNRGIVN